MKFQFKYMLMAATVAVLSAGAVSCSEDGMRDLEGVYQAPADLTITGASLVDKTKEGNLRTFHIALNSSEGTTLNLALVSNQYYLAGNGYTPANAAAAKNGNMIQGASTVNGSAVVDGSISITQLGDDYTVNNSVLFTEDGKSYRFKGAFTLSFEPDDPTAMPILKSATANPDGTVTVVFSTGGYTETLNMTTYQMEYAGEGNDLQIIFNCPDGKLHEGVYSPGIGYVAGYTFMNDAYTMWGIPAFEDYAGSLWYTIANGAKVPSLVKTGDIVVTKNGPLYTILIDQGKGGIFAQFQGSIADLDPDGGGNVSLYSTLLGVTNWASFGWGVNFIDIALADGTVTASTGADGTTTYAGTGTLLNIEPFSADGTLARGEYTIDANGAPGVCIAGADNPWSPGNPGGTYLRTITNGVPGDVTYITSGTLTIEGEGDATKITLETEDTTYMFSGNLGL